ncbi:MAG TPA: protoheme IX farnesyltransferase [Alphaproteobacteria bacterium]|nr:protoheme IX farnesyltransferase [Alphaproteobacteria bacterium]
MAQVITTQPHLASPGDLFALMKPRVMSLVIFTALVGMLVSPMDAHPILMIISLLAIAAGAGASGAINQWYDRDIDAQMERTANRPLPQGLVQPDEALSLGLIISVLSVLVLYFTGGASAAAMLAFTIFFYGFIYTVWLKRSTTQNIVIGGAAGAFPPVIGWLAAGGDFGLAPAILFLIIFAWTPPHFWALALVRNDDYTRVGVPMFPVIHGFKATKNQIFIYALIVAVAGMIPTLIGLSSYAYMALSAVLGLRFVMLSWAVWRSDDADLQTPMVLFRFSILYLFLIFLGLGLDAAIAPFWMGT